MARLGYPKSFQIELQANLTFSPLVRISAVGQPGRLSSLRLRNLSTVSFHACLLWLLLTP